MREQNANIRRKPQKNEKKVNQDQTISKAKLCKIATQFPVKIQVERCDPSLANNFQKAETTLKQSLKV